MNTSLKLSRRFASVLLLGAVLASGAAAQKSSSADLLQRTEAARTKGDYQALARDYDMQAAAARANAAEHRKLAKRYQGILAGRGGISMPAHCDAIASKSEGLAADYEAMAVAYRQLAKQAQP